MEHRHGARYKALALADIQYRDGRRTGLIYNISNDGMFVLTDAPEEVTGGVELYISSDGKGRAVRIPGLVVHNNNNGFGMIFRDLDDAARTLLDKYLA